MFQLEVLFLMQLVIGILMVVFLQKLLQIKKQVDDIVREVKEYITFITEEEETDERVLKNESDYMEKTERKFVLKENKEEAQTKLIQAVLGEYFP